MDRALQKVSQATKGGSLSKRYYVWTRDLHLYLGLFISPFLVVFAGSVFFLNHARAPIEQPTTAVTFHDVQIPKGVEETQGSHRLDHAKQILAQLGVTGEINFIRYLSKERRLVIPVLKPGIETKIDLDIENRTATVSQRKTSVWEMLAYLHKSPGPHNVAIRGNWIWTRVWGWMADATVYLVMFVSISGIYLWAMIRADRKAGLVLLAAGALLFGGVLCALTI